MIFVSVILVFNEINTNSEAVQVNPLLQTVVESSYDVIIIGGGIAGLSAAFFLDEFDIKVLEKENRVGGRAISGIYQGFSYAKGTEYLGKPEGIIEEIVNQLNLRPLEIPSPTDVLFFNQTYFYGDDGSSIMYIQNSSLEELNRFIATIKELADQYEDVPELDLESDIAGLDDLSAQEWLEQSGYSEIYLERFNVAARGLFGANLEEISALSFVPEIAFDYFDAEPITNPNELENEFNIGEYETGTYSFMTGIDEITNAIAVQLGDKVQLNSTVTQVIEEEDRILVQYSDLSGILHTLEADCVILTVPAPVALDIASEALLTEQIEILKQIQYAVYATMALFSNEPIFNQGFDLTVPGDLFFTDVYDSTWVQRFYEPTLKNQQDYINSVYVAPQTFHDRSLLGLSDDELLSRMSEDLEKIFTGVNEKIVGFDIQRFPYAYPIMTLGAYKRLTRLHEINQGQLLLAGDYMIYPTFEAAAESGRMAAENAIEELETISRIKNFELY